MKHTESNKFYVYFHLKKDTGDVFYVGKGFGRRAYNKNSRSLHWNNTVLKHGIKIIIHQGNLSETDALELEKKLICYYGRKDHNGKLVNLTDGGDGISGYRHTCDTKKKMSIKARIHKTGSKDSDATKFKKKIAAQKRGMQSWIGQRNAELHRKKFSAISPTGESHVFIGIKNMAVKNNINRANASQCLSGIRKTVSGWSNFTLLQ